MTPAERRFKEIAKRKHWYVLRPSWPDFLCAHEGELFAVEVKYDKDWVSERQRLTFELLREHGFPVYMWHAAFHKNLFPWNDVRTHWAGIDYKNPQLPAYAQARREGGEEE